MNSQFSDEMKKNIFDELLKVISTNPQGIVLFLGGSLVMTLLHLVHRKEVIKGHKGTNGLWEPAEWTLYWFSWICPYIIIGAATKVMDPPPWVWYFLGFMLVYGLMGNKGAEAILAWRGFGAGAKTTTESTQILKTKVETEPKPPLEGQQ